MWEDGSVNPYAWHLSTNGFDALPAEPAGREWFIALWFREVQRGGAAGRHGRPMTSATPKRLRSAKPYVLKAAVRSPEGSKRDDDLAGRAGLNRRTVGRTLRLLERRGLVKVVHRGGCGAECRAIVFTGCRRAVDLGAWVPLIPDWDQKRSTSSVERDRKTERMPS
jgi:hypothetical protein